MALLWLQYCMCDSCIVCIQILKSWHSKAKNGILDFYYILYWSNDLQLMWGYIQATNLLHKDSIKTEEMPLNVQNPKVTSNFSVISKIVVHSTSSLNNEGLSLLYWPAVPRWYLVLVCRASCWRTHKGSDLNKEYLVDMLPSCHNDQKHSAQPLTLKEPEVCSYRIHDVLFKPPTSFKNYIFLLYGVEFIFSTIY